MSGQLTFISIMFSMALVALPMGLAWAVLDYFAPYPLPGWCKARAQRIMRERRRMQLYNAAAVLLRYPLQEVNGWCVPVVPRGCWARDPGPGPRPRILAGWKAHKEWREYQRAANTRSLPTVIEFRWNPFVALLGPNDRPAFEAAIHERTGASWRFDYQAPVNKIVAERMPDPIPLPVDDHADGACKLPYRHVPIPGQLVFGIAEGGEPIGWEYRLSPHGIVAGTSTGGKTVTALSIIMAALESGIFKLFVGDPKIEDLEPCADHPRVLSYGNDAEDILRTVALALGEMESRKARCKRRGRKDDRAPERIADIIEAEGRFLLVLDEWTSLVTKTGDRKSDKTLATITAMVAKLTQQAAAVGGHVLCLGQSLGYDHLPTWMKVNMEFRVIVGRTTPSGSEVMLEDQAGASLPGVKGRMAVRRPGGAVTVAQGFHTTPELVAAYVAVQAQPDDILELVPEEDLELVLSTVEPDESLMLA